MPITPVFEQPPVNRHARQIDWQPVLDVLAEHPNEWARVDGPFANNKTGGITARGKSLRSFAKTAEVEVEVCTARKDDATWLYARTVAKVDSHPQGGSKPAPKPFVAVPDVAAPHTEFGGDHDCGTCGATFRTNTRLRQHQANAHKAS